MSYRLHPTKNRKLPPDSPKKWYYVEYYPRGKKHGIERDCIFATQAEAADYDRDNRRELRTTAINVNPQFYAILPDFLEWYAIERLPGTVETAKLHISHLEKRFKNLPLTAIPQLVSSYKKNRLAEGVKPITINKELNTLSVIFKYAKEENLIAARPAIDRFPPKKTKSPIPILPPFEEMEAVVNEIRGEVRGMVMLEFYAGLRRAESSTLRAEDVLLGRRLMIVKGKGEKQRIVPINDILLPVLQERINAVKTGYLWINPTTERPYKRLDESIKNAALRLGYSGRWYHHLFRHGFGTACIESGMGAKTVQFMMGHVSQSTTDIYTHLAAKHLRKEMDKWGSGE